MSDRITMTPSQMIARLEATNADTKATIREAHETIQSLRLLIREAKECVKELRDTPPEVVREELNAAVHAELAELGPAMKEHMAACVDHVEAEFSKLSDAILGGGRSGKPPLIDAAKRYAEARLTEKQTYLPVAGIRAGECPECKAQVRNMMAVTGPDGSLANPGDVSVCSRCGAASRVTADLGRRPLLAFELDQMELAEREAIVVAQTVIRARA